MQPRINMVRIKMKKFILALAGVVLVSGQAAADNYWKYVVIDPDGNQVASAAPQMDISYPPDETSNHGGVPAPQNQRAHLIIVAPDAYAPEPTFLSNKAAETTVEAPPKNLPHQEEQPATADEPQAVRRALAPPPTRNFLNSGSNVRR